MKKILSLLTLALVSVGLVWATKVSEPEPKAADASGAEKTIVSMTLEKAPEGAKAVTVSDVIDIAFGTPKSGDAWALTELGDNAVKIKYADKEYTFPSYASTSSTNGNDKATNDMGGTTEANYVAFVPKYDGKIIIAVHNAGSNKKFYLYEDGKVKGGTLIGTGEGTATFSGDAVLDASAAYTGGLLIDVKAGSKYTVSVSGSKGRWMGFIYEYAAGKTVTRALIDYPTDKTGATIEGTTAETNVKIHENKDEVPCLQLKNGYTTSDGIMNGNDIKLAVDGGFKKGDVVTIAGAINNSDATKRATAVLFSADSDKKPTVLKTFSDFINGRLVKDDPKEESFTLEEDYDVLYLGRDGGTAASLTLIKVTREEPAEEDPDENLTFAAYTSLTSLDFNSAVNGAVSRGGRHKGDLTTENAAKEGIALPFVINAADATLTIAPNEDATNYPEGSEPCSKFIETVAGPQLLISGGYSGATLTLDKTTTDFNEIKLNLTNWSKKMTAKATNAGADVEGIFDPATGVWKSKNAGETADKIVFTVQADTTWVCESKFKPKDPKKPDGDQVYDGYKLIEVVHHDMGIVKINSIEINPVYDVIVDAADGTELSAAVAAATAAIKNPKNLIINLAAGGNYTVTNSIITALPTTINGNGATIDASENANAFILMSSSPNDADYNGKFYILDKMEIKNVTIKGLTNLLYHDNNKAYLFNTFSIDNSVIALASEKTPSNEDQQAAIRFQAGGALTFSITNSTIYQTGDANVQYFTRFQSGNFPDKAGLADDYEWTIVYKNNTFYKVASNQWNNPGRFGNAKTHVVVDIANNIWVDCSKNGDIIRRMFNSTNTSNFKKVTISDNNTCILNGNSVDQSGYDKSGSKWLTSAPVFADAAKGDFTLGDCDQKTAETGDPRWLGMGSGAITGIEAVKEAKTAEDGAWYTIQGQRVAQPTKGLYIHNGKKVVIK